MECARLEAFLKVTFPLSGRRSRNCALCLHSQLVRVSLCAYTHHRPCSDLTLQWRIMFPPVPASSMAYRLPWEQFYTSGHFVWLFDSAASRARSEFRSDKNDKPMVAHKLELQGNQQAFRGTGGSADLSLTLRRGEFLSLRSVRLR